MIPSRRSSYTNIPPCNDLPSPILYPTARDQLLKARNDLKDKLHVGTDITINTGVRNAVINALNSDDRLEEIRGILYNIASSYINVADDSSTTELSATCIREGLHLTEYVGLCLLFAAGSN